MKNINVVKKIKGQARGVENVVVYSEEASLPETEIGDAGKAVVVNDDGSGYNLAELGANLYRHCIRSSDANFPETSFICNQSTAFSSIASLSAFLNSIGCTKNSIYYMPLSGAVSVATADGYTLKLFNKMQEGTNNRVAVSVTIITIASGAISNITTSTVYPTQSFNDKVTPL